ncbi:MAG: TolC family protein [Candidatus Eremiobacteraeota bacterium]|nr:TolC family protein [Candidatus Eremiobacteraeota bacterium]MCW5872097.1 TolC family protein [Candidatus Eremiobacteraeota bacterium]
MKTWLTLFCWLPLSCCQALTLGDALRQAEAHNGELAAARAREQQAAAQAQGAGSLPTAQLGVAGLGGNGPGLTNSNYSNLFRDDYYVFWNQSSGPFGSLASKKRSAEFRHQAARQAVRSQRLQLEQSVKDEFYRLLAAQQRLEVNQRNLELAEEVLRIARTRHKVGQVPRLDLMSAEVERNRAQQELVTATSELRQSKARLGPLLGQSPQDLQAEGDLTPAPAPLIQSLQEHPRLAAAAAELQQARQETLLAAQQGNPSANLNLVHDLVVPNYVLQVTLAIPLDWGELGYEYAARQAAEAEAEAKLEHLRKQLESELEVARSAYQSALENQISYREKVLDPAEEMARVTEKGYRKGALPYTQLLVAQRLVSDLRRQFIDKQLEVQLALDALQAALGQQP